MEIEYIDIEEIVRVWIIFVIKYYILCYDVEVKYFLLEWYFIGLNYVLNKYKYNFF